MTASDPKRTFEERPDAKAGNTDYNMTLACHPDENTCGRRSSIRPPFGLPDRRHEYFIELCETLICSIPDAVLITYRYKARAGEPAVKFLAAVPRRIPDPFPHRSDGSGLRKIKIGKADLQINADPRLLPLASEGAIQHLLPNGIGRTHRHLFSLRPGLRGTPINTESPGGQNEQRTIELVRSPRHGNLQA
jgi:hypothetical protein